MSLFPFLKVLIKIGWGSARYSKWLKLWPGKKVKDLPSFWKLAWEAAH